MKAHWRMFSGSHTTNPNVYEEIKEQKHVPDNITEDQLFSWIEHYLESLKNTMNIYQYIRYPSKHVESSEYPQISKSIYVIGQFGPREAMLPYILAIMSKESHSDKKEQILSLLEKLVIRSIGISNTRQVHDIRNKLTNHSHQIYWSDKEKTIFDITKQEEATTFGSLIELFRRFN